MTGNEVSTSSPRSFVTVVSGYPRSGTSLMLQMLEAGGLPVLRDDVFRPPDERNPRGYYEINAALSLGEQGQGTDWVAEAVGAGVKVIAFQLKFLPTRFDYRVVFMRRRVTEVLASSGAFGMLRTDSPLDEREKVMAYKTEYVVYEAWLQRQGHFRTIFINYNDLLENLQDPSRRYAPSSTPLPQPR